MKISNKKIKICVLTLALVFFGIHFGTQQTFAQEGGYTSAHEGYYPENANSPSYELEEVLQIKVKGLNDGNEK